MKKRMLAALLTAVVLAGCGSSTESGRGSYGPAEEQEKKEEEKDVTEPEEEVKDSDNTGDEVSEPTPDEADSGTENNEAGEAEEPTPDIEPHMIAGDFYAEIEICWDETGVEFYGDAGDYDFGNNPSCAPMTVIEGNGAEQEILSDGTLHREIVHIVDDTEAVRVTVMPSVFTNNCPLATVTAEVRYANGDVETVDIDSRLVRGEAGIWYVEVYEQ